MSDTAKTVTVKVLFSPAEWRAIQRKHPRMLTAPGTDSASVRNALGLTDEPRRSR